MRPIGFVCDHVEILYDVDILFRKYAQRARYCAAPPGIAERFAAVHARARGRGAPKAMSRVVNRRRRHLGVVHGVLSRQARIGAAIIERQPRLGGVIRTDKVSGCVLEAGPDSFIAQKPWAFELIRALGLGADVIGSNDHLRVTYVVKRGRLVPLPDGLMLMIPTKILPMLGSPLLGWGTKLRMGLEWFRRPSKDEARRSIGSALRGVALRQ